MKKKQLYDEINTISNKVSDVRANLESLDDELKAIESRLESLPSEDYPLEED